jgi:hypothetical protein
VLALSVRDDEPASRPDKQIADAAGGKHDYESRIVGYSKSGEIVRQVSSSAI